MGLSPRQITLQGIRQTLACIQEGSRGTAEPSYVSVIGRLPENPQMTEKLKQKPRKHLIMGQDQGPDSAVTDHGCSKHDP